MPQKVRIALDAMGGDIGASVVVPGAAISLARHPGSEFLLFGDSAMESVLFKVEGPTVGLLNIGVREIKRHEEIRVAADLLRAMNLPQLNYVGFVEGDGIG